jgi:hypothetical protein
MGCMKTSEQRLQETINRVKDLTPELRIELENCIETAADVRNFLVRNGKIRSRGRGSPWIGSVEHVRKALSDSGGGVIQDPALPIPPTDSRRGRPGYFIAAILISLVCFGLALIARMRAFSPQPPVEGKRTTEKVAFEQIPETTKAERVPGAAPDRSGASPQEVEPLDKPTLAVEETGAAPVPAERERLLGEIAEFMAGGPLPRAAVEVQLMPLPPAASMVIRRSLDRVGMAFGPFVHDRAIEGFEKISEVSISGTTHGLEVHVKSQDSIRTAEAFGNLLAVTPGCQVGGTIVETIHHADGVREISGPAIRILVHGVEGWLRWSGEEVTLRFSLQEPQM